MMAPPNYTQFNIFFLVCRSCGKKLYTKRGYILTLHFIHLMSGEDDAAFLEVSIDDVCLLGISF